MGLEHFGVKRNLRCKKLFGPRRILGPRKILGLKKNLVEKKILDPKIFFGSESRSCIQFFEKPGPGPRRDLRLKFLTNRAQTEIQDLIF